MAKLSHLMRSGQSAVGRPANAGMTVSRRIVMVGALAVAVTPFESSLATPAGERTVFFIETYKRLVGETEPDLRDVTVEILATAENGNTVPFTINVLSPMTPEAYVKTVTLLSTGNPQAVVGTFHFSTHSGLARVSGRMRLARTQDVVAVAELNSGQLIRGQTNVQVMIGGCGG
jgi:sulfur-oxidizing protein SoxY